MEYVTEAEVFADLNFQSVPFKIFGIAVGLDNRIGIITDEANKYANQNG